MRQDQWESRQSRCTVPQPTSCAAFGLAARPIAPLGPWQPYILAQRHARILPVEQAASLQLGYHQAHEVLIGTRDVGGSEHKAIACLSREPLLEPVCDLVRGTDEEWQFVQRATSTVSDKITRSRIALAAEADDAVVDGPRAADGRQVRIRERLIQTVRREVEVQHLGEEHESV